MTHRSRLALLALFGVFMAYGIVFLAQRNQVLQNSRNLTESAEPLADWIGKYPTDFEALIAMMARTHFQHQQCPENCDHWQKKSLYLSDLWEKQDPPIAAGWLLAARIALQNERPEQARRYIDHALALHPGMPQAWKFKLGAFSHDPNYATWYKEAAQWLHGTYHLKGFKQP